MFINKAIVIGNITKDLELKSLPNGSKICSFNVATNRTWKDQNGAKQEAVDYHNIVSFGKQAEVICQWMKKGSQIYVEGRMTTRSWEDKDTKKKMYRTEIVAENIQFGPKKDGEKTQENTPKSEGETSTEQMGFAQVGDEKINNSKVADKYDGIDFGESLNPDDIPF